jgi:four helix bundle protein
MAVRRFEDLVAWQKARELTGLIYDLTRSSKFARDFGLRDLVQRAAVSIMSNVAEGFERARRPEFHQFLSIAKASCAEVRSLLYVARDVGYIDDEQFARAMSLAEQVARIIGALRVSVARPRE